MTVFNFHLLKTSQHVLKYLPVNTHPTTSVTLLISPTQENEEFTDGFMHFLYQIESDLSNDILQNYLMKNDKYMAHGVEQIYSTLKTVNEKARDPNNAEIRNCQYHLKAKFQLPLNVPSGWKVYFMDNPGFDECSPHVAEVAMRGQGLSSATLYITTFEQHRQVNTTGFIQSMYQKDNDIFKERRLIIVVNKLDKTCYNSTSLYSGEDDEEKTPEDITSEVHEFIVKICKCHPEDIPRDIIIPMCGLWAYRARKLARMPGSHKCRNDVVRALCAVKSLPAGQEESRESCYVALPSQEIASHLESLAGICELERKLQDMAKSSILVWIRKISHDFDMFLQGSFKKLSRRVETLAKKQKEDSQDIENELEVMQEIYEMYDEISKIPADEQLIQRFKESFSEDMQELDLRDMADQKVQKKLKEFQDRLKDAVKVRKYYGPKEFLQDLKIFIQELSASLKPILNSFTKMKGTCSQEFHKITCRVARLGTKLESSSLAFDDLLKKEVKCVMPKIKGPEVEKAMSISLPILGERLQDKLWGKCHSGVSSDQETPSSARRKRGFRKLSELENVFGELQDSLTAVAQDYFNNLEVIMLEKFSISYYEAAINYLKNFEESYRGLLDMKTQEMNSRLYQLLTDTKKLEDDVFQRSQLTYMRTQFAFMSQKYQKTFFIS